MRHANVGASPRKLVAALVIAILASSLAAPAATAEKRYGPGVSDTEIKIGNTMPYSGPLSKQTYIKDQTTRTHSIFGG